MDSIWVVVITGFFVLAGAISGYVASAIQTSRAFDRQFKLEELRRTWQLDDESRAHRIAVRARRCDQAEKSVSAMSEDFHHLRTQSISFVNAAPRSEFGGDFHDFAHWQRHIDRSVFEYGPVINALSGSQHDLVSPWKTMEQAWLDMANHYRFLYQQKVAEGKDLDDPEGMLKDINDVYGAFNNGLGLFIVEVDRVRARPLAPEDPIGDA